jgi:hypothetical protein
MRIDSSGNLLVGATSGAGRLRVIGQDSTSSNYTFVVVNSSANNILFTRNDGATCMPPVYSSFTTGSAANVFIDSSGFLYRSTSSLRYKENVQNYGKGLSDLAKLRPVTFTTKAKNANEEIDMHIHAGFIAEEVHDAGLTEFVQYNAEGQPDALAYQNMVALLTKSLQEAVAKIDALETRIATLEKK